MKINSKRQVIFLPKSTTYTLPLYILLNSEVLCKVSWLSHCLTDKHLQRVKTKEAAWTKYHEELHKLTANNLSLMLTMTLSRRCMKILIDKNFHMHEGVAQQQNVSITDDDMDVIQYIGGFVLQRLKKANYRLLESTTKANRQRLLNCLISSQPEDSLLLTEIKQRGGLLTPEPDLLKVFSRLELSIRQFTGGTPTDLSLQDIVSHACSDSKLRKLFGSLCEDSIADQCRDFMFGEVCKTYVITRIRGFTRQVMERYRNEMKVRKSQKSLRATLQQESSLV